MPSGGLRCSQQPCATGGLAWGQSPTCVFSATAIPVHQEGLAEPVGDVNITCTGGTAASTVSLTMFVTLNATITNRLDANGDLVGIGLTGATLGALRLSSPTTVSLNAANYTIPPVPATPVTMVRSGLRVAVAPLGPGVPVIASVVGIGAIFNSGAQLPWQTHPLPSCPPPSRTVSRVMVLPCLPPSISPPLPPRHLPLPYESPEPGRVPTARRVSATIPERVSWSNSPATVPEPVCLSRTPLSAIAEPHKLL